MFDDVKVKDPEIWTLSLVGDVFGMIDEAFSELSIRDQEALKVFLEDSEFVGQLYLGVKERLMENLGVLPGAVSPFAMINGVKNNVTIFIDSELKSYKNVFAHPLENNQTLEITFDQLEKFFKKIFVTTYWIDL